VGGVAPVGEAAQALEMAWRCDACTCTGRRSSEASICTHHNKGTAQHKAPTAQREAPVSTRVG